MSDIKFEAWETIMIAILVLFLGQAMNKRIRFLSRFNIPEPVSSGVIVAVFVSIYFLSTGKTISFDLFYRDILLVVFFTCVGLSSSFADLKQGGKPFFILLILCSILIFIQNSVGMGLASAMGIHPNVGLMGGSISMVGGLGTSIAWGKVIAAEHGLPNAMEIGIACATMGLVMGSVAGGPIGEYLIRKNKLEPQAGSMVSHVEVKHGEEVPVSEDSFIYTVFIIGVAVGMGMYLNHLLGATTFRLPAYVTCMFSGILLSNTLPLIFKKLDWPTRHASLNLISDLSLGLFLSLTLMSLQLWTLVSAAAPILVIMAAQLLATSMFVIFVIFNAIKRDYDAAVICAGTMGFGLGATPNAIANMHAITGKYGYSPFAFIIVPLVGGFFLDLVNAVVIELFLII
ncbi:MAG TPA: sodium/glutamate symporter [Chitinophagaceae bacterium]|nr:sodium/glutamate symporter [Chitinophagaceae bacterium]